LTAAHRTLAFGSLVEVRNRDNGKKVVVRINDRGPFIRGRIIDLSLAGARAIEMVGPGTARVEIRVMDDHRRARSKSPSTAGYLVQAAAFRERKKASRLAARLERAYPGVRVSSGEGWHRVILGPYPTRQEAEQVVRDLEPRGVAALVRVDD
jgi:rare lipoprotein A